jgi:DNA-binding HxlR family transcriptional regulator
MNVTTPLSALPECGQVGEILSRVGDKWTVQVVVALRNQPRRFNDIKRKIGGISQQMLTRTLKTLERDGLVKRAVAPTTPPQVTYSLTALGRSLSEPVQQLAKWARAHIATIYEHRSRYDTRRMQT